MGTPNVLIVSCVALVLGFNLVPPEGFKASWESPAKTCGVLKLAHVSSQKPGLSDKYLFELPEKRQENGNPQIYPNLSHICFPEYTKIAFAEAARVDAKQQGLLRASWSATENWVEIWGSSTWMLKNLKYN